MATINFSITGVQVGYSNWAGSFTVSDATAVIKNDTSISNITITVGGDNYSFDPTGSVYLWPDADLGHDYVTWRTQNIATQFPNTGISIDIWSPTLYVAINSDSKWNELSNYNLSSVKHTLVYDYDVMYAPYYSRGGNIAFTVV